MKKELIKAQLIKTVKDEVIELEKICETAQGLVQNGDLKSDGKYDTRSTEAGYLAGAQTKRLEELKLEMSLIEGIPTNPFSKGADISIGDLVEIEFNSQVRKYYVSSSAGGSMVNIDGETILVISVFSPIGSGVLGLSLGDEFEVEVSSGTRIYKILQAY